MPLKAKRLKGLKIDEVSGVDAPAHLSPGWMVLKSAAGGDPLAGLSDEQIEDVIKALEADEQGEPVDDLIATLTKAAEAMPEPAKAAAVALIGALGGNATAAAGDPVAKAVADALTKASADQKAAEDRATAAEAELAKAKGAAPAPTDDELVAKAMESWPEPIRKQWAAQQERIAKAEEKATKAAEDAQTERDARVSGEYLAKARGPEYSGIAKAETLATVLREVDEKLSKEAGAELHRILKAAAHLANGGAADFAVYGGVGADVSGAGAAQAQIEAAAAEIAKSDPTISREQAIVKAYDALPDLAAVAMGGEG